MMETLTRPADTSIAASIALLPPQERAEALYLATGTRDLESEFTTWVPGEGMPSPNRLDAMVWAITELMLGDHPQQRPAHAVYFADDIGEDDDED